MSASSGKDPLLNAVLENDLDGNAKKIVNADLSDSSNTFPSNPATTIPHTSNALKGDGVGNIADSKVALTSPANGATITVADGKTLTVSNTVTITATDNSTLAIGSGGTLGTAAYTPATNYATSTQGAKADSIGAVNGLVKSDGASNFSAATAKTDYWDTTVAVASGASHAIGLVPDPGASSGTTKFLCEDMTYRVPPAASGVVLDSTTHVIKGDNAGGGVDSKWVLTAPSTLATLTAGADSCTYTLPDITTNIGFRHIPQNSKSAAYTTVLTDSGKCIFHPAADTNARTFTIDSNANVAYPLGTVIEFINRSPNAVTIAITSDTLTLAGTGSTGSRTLAQYGRANAEKIGTTEWLISGVGLT